MNKATKILAVVLMLVAALMAIYAWWLGQLPTTTPVVINNTTPTTSQNFYAVAAAQSISKGKTIAAEDLTIVNLPIATAGTYTDLAEVVGRVPSNDIERDTLITSNSLVQGLALRLAPGERAVAVPVDEVVGVGNKIAAGDYVDVFFTLKQGNDIEHGQARLLASRRYVLAYGAAVIGEAESRGVTGANNANTQQPARTAVLATPVEEVNQLLLAAQSGKLTLALRNPADTAIADPSLFNEPRTALLVKNSLTDTEKKSLSTVENQAYSGVDMASWAGNGSAAKPNGTTINTKPTGSMKKSTGNLEVIKGTQRQSVQF